MKRSQTLMLQVKENRVVLSAHGAEPAAAFVARRLHEERPSEVVEFLTRDAVLVPVPRSGLHKPHALWPAHEIATALVARGFGRRVLACLRRETAVPKAATATPGNRPGARQHFDSLAVDGALDLPSSVVLVDDVVTRGASLLGAAWRLWKAREDLDVRAFAVIRTISNPATFTQILDPCQGLISWENGHHRRVP